MTDNQINALATIEEQQRTFKDGEPAYGLAEQLKDICKAEPVSAELIFTDLSVEAMSIRSLEKEIKKRADEKHKKNGGNAVCVTPKEADEIIRKFYALPNPDNQEKLYASPVIMGSISLDDFFK